MSQPPPEAPRRAEPRTGRKENVFTRKIGPLPMWVWLLIVAAIIIAWALFAGKKKKNQQAQAASARAGAGQVPQFVNQTFVGPEPPEPPEPEPRRKKHHRRDRDHDDDDDDRKYHRPPPEPLSPPRSRFAPFSPGTIPGGAQPIPAPVNQATMGSTNG